MRIIGGEWRGRKIEEPRGRDVTRPTTDRAVSYTHLAYGLCLPFAAGVE